MIKKGLIHVMYIDYALYSVFYCQSVSQSVSQLVHTFVLWLVLLSVLPPVMHFIGALSVHSFIGLSIGQLVHPLVLWLVLLLVLPPDGCIVVCLSDLFFSQKAPVYL